MVRQKTRKPHFFPRNPTPHANCLSWRKGVAGCIGATDEYEPRIEHGKLRVRFPSVFVSGKLLACPCFIRVDPWLAHRFGWLPSLPATIPSHTPIVVSSRAKSVNYVRAFWNAVLEGGVATKLARGPSVWRAGWQGGQEAPRSGGRSGGQDTPSPGGRLGSSEYQDRQRLASTVPPGHRGLDLAGRRALPLLKKK